MKEAVQAHGENITVVSTEGVGTEFHFHFRKLQANVTGNYPLSSKKKVTSAHIHRNDFLFYFV